MDTIQRKLMSLRVQENPGPNQPNFSSSSQDCQMADVVWKYEHQGSIISGSGGDKKGKWLKHYSSNHRILLVGEGDFSFSLSLAMAFGSASKIVATSFDSYDVVIKKYKAAKTNLEILHSLGAELLHEVEALQMKLHTGLQMQIFDRIIFNFPHAGFLGLEDDQQVIKIHQILVCGFFKNASGMLCPKGEVHVAHKTSYPFQFWNIEQLATQNSLTLLERIEFKREDYPGYNNKRGDGKRADAPFPLGECSTYKFVLFSKGSNSSKNDELCNCGPLRRVNDGLTVRVSKEGSVITCQICFEIGHNNKTCKNEPVAPPPKIDKKKGGQRMIWKLKVDMETEESQTVGGQSSPRGQTVGGQVGPRGQTVGETFLSGRDLVPVPSWPPGVPMASASEMAKKTAATKHNLVVDSGRQIGAATPSQQVTPKNKQQTSQQAPKKRTPTAAKPSQQVTPKKKQQTGQQQQPHNDGLSVRVSKEGSVITCQICFEIGHNNKTCKNEPVAPPPKIAKKKERQSMIWKLKVDMETEGSQTVGGQTVGGQVGPRGQTVGGQVGPPGVPMASASEMAKKTAATKHNLLVDSGRQIGAAIPSQQVTPKNKQQTSQQPPPQKLLKIKPTAAIQPEGLNPRLLKKTGTTSASKTTGAKPKKRTPTAAKPSQQVTPKKKQQPPQKLLKIKPTAAIQPEGLSPRLLKKTGTTSASVSKTTAATPKKSEWIVKKKLSMHVDGPGSSSHNAMTL